MMDFIDKHRGVYGVEPICKVLQVAPSGYRGSGELRRGAAHGPDAMTC